MTNNPPPAKGNEENDCYLPDFCHAEANLRLILILELVAIVLALADMPSSTSLFTHVALVSLYVQWIGLTTAVLLCLLRRLRVLSINAVVTSAVSLLVLVVVTALVVLGAHWINSQTPVKGFDLDSISATLVRHEAMALILFGLALRYFYVQHRAQQMILMESRSRLQALQARIRPHFLFNSLNTIASLTYDEPERAERAIENLADLFRASLRADISVTLEREIELTRDYIELEQLRLDDRLRVVWDIRAPTTELTLPALTLQPLVENAIYHGIEPAPDGGEVTVSIYRDDAFYIEITNPAFEQGAHSHREGNRMALDNIAERLLLAFEGRAKIEHVVENDLYRVVITLPFV
jgi:two-component system sensor histidine kinase AlgZ